MTNGRNVFAHSMLSEEPPRGVWRELELPRRDQYFPSPASWRNEVIYFLLVDRFSDGQEGEREPLTRSEFAAARQGTSGGRTWRWDLWAQSGADRWQGGTLDGVVSKLDYLVRLGLSAIWLSPVFKQRGHLDSYHGYGIQDFLDVDPHFGDRADLVRLVQLAHERGVRVILDVIFNHSGPNWLYPPDTPGGPDTPRYTTGRYPFGAWRGAEGQPISRIQGPEEAVWPVELQVEDRYTRAGAGDLGAGDISDPEAEHKRTDFITLRDFRLDEPGLLTDLARCYKYWIALTDCDGFRIDTLKHVDSEEARNFCGSIKEFATNLGKEDFFLVGEIAGGDVGADRYLDVLGQNLNAALDIGEMRLALTSLAKGLSDPRVYFDGFDPGNAIMGSHRNIGERHVSVLDDHDHVFGDKVRFSAAAASDHQVAAAVAVQLLTLGIPCIYYGSEQALAGPEPSEWRWLPEWTRSDRYLREAMFGPEHPRAAGRDGLSQPPEGLDEALPGFGPFGTAGRHCFDESHPAYKRIAAVAALRHRFPVLRAGRQYLRPTSFLGRAFDTHGAGELVAWSRILDDDEALCVLNPHGADARGADILVDAELNAPGSSFVVALNSAQAGIGERFSGSHRVGSLLPLRRAANGIAYVEVRDVGPSEVLVLTNHADS